MFAAFNELQRLEITLYTDALITHGLVRTRQHRVSDILNLSEDPFLILEDVTVEEFGQRGETITAAFAQINLDAVLFAVATTPVEPVPELRTPKVQEEAIISIPPFRVTGIMHLLPMEGNLRAALSELQGRFLPITEATFWSDHVGEPRQQAVLVAVNHRRAQILAPHKVQRPVGGRRTTRGGVAAAEAIDRPPTRARSRRGRPRSIRGGWSRRPRPRADRPLRRACSGVRARVPRSAALGEASRPRRPAGTRRASARSRPSSPTGPCPRSRPARSSTTCSVALSMPRVVAAVGSLRTRSTGCLPRSGESRSRGGLREARRHARRASADRRVRAQAMDGGRSSPDEDHYAFNMPYAPRARSGSSRPRRWSWATVASAPGDPGPVDTAGWTTSSREPRSRQSTGRLGTPEDVAGLVRSCRTTGLDLGQLIHRTAVSARRRTRLAVHREVQAVAPLGPAAVVDRHVLVAQHHQHVGELRRRDARTRRSRRGVGRG